MPTNAERATAAEAGITEYTRVKESRTRFDPDDVADLLCDLMHFCKREKIDFYEQLLSARDNFDNESKKLPGWFYAWEAPSGAIYPGGMAYSQRVKLS